MRIPCEMESTYIQNEQANNKGLTQLCNVRRIIYWLNGQTIKTDSGEIHMHAIAEKKNTLMSVPLRDHGPKWFYEMMHLQKKKRLIVQELVWDRTPP